MLVREQVVVPEGTKGARYTQSGQWIVDGEELLDVGGSWDRRLGDYVEDTLTDSGRIEVSIHPGQVLAVEWFADWLDRYVAGNWGEDEARDFSAILSGGQRAGKTWVAVGVFAVAFAACIPDSIVWLVAPTVEGFEEFEDILEGADGVLARSWYERTGDHYWLANGSRIVMRSAHDPEALKVGRCDLLIMNECQRMKKKAESVCRARIADRGGLLVGCANPPDRPIGEWVGDWVSETDSGERSGKHFWFNPYDNPHTNHKALDDAAESMDEKAFAIEILGKFYSVGDVVLYNWERLTNESTLPKIAKLFGVGELREITREVTKRREGRAFDRVLGVDVQRRPMASVELRFFENPLCPMPDDQSGDLWIDWCIVVYTDEVVLDGEEEDLVIGWNEKGWDPDETLIICDASARWQFAERQPLKVEKRREEVKGRGSWAVFKNGGFRHIRTPQKGSEKNPDRVERCRATTARIKTSRAGKYGQHFLFALTRCKRTTKAIRNWPNDKKGQPSNRSEHSHLGDALTYPVNRLFPRKLKRKIPPPKIISKPKRKEAFSVF